MSWKRLFSRILGIVKVYVVELMILRVGRNKTRFVPVRYYQNQMENEKMNRIEGFNEDSPASYRLNTMLPFDVFTEFIRFCKDNAMTGLSRWDFGVGLRILLMKAKYADMLYDMDKRISLLESNKETNNQPEVEPKTVKTFGITKNKEVINGKIWKVVR
jgi:hypothetical protein